MVCYAERIETGIRGGADMVAQEAARMAMGRRCGAAPGQPSWRRRLIIAALAAGHFCGWAPAAWATGRDPLGLALAATQSELLAATSRRPRVQATSPERGAKSSVFAVDNEPTRPRSDIFIPLVSFFLPGFDQWWEGQYTAAALYTGAALSGYLYQSATVAANDLVYAREVRKQQQAKNGSDQSNNDAGFDQKDVAERKYTLGGLVAQGAGGMSAYHSFRTAVRTRQAHGEYGFLTKEESPLDIFAAPLHFQYLARPTTWIPLTIALALAGLQVRGEPPVGMQHDTLSSADWFFASAFSYNAGTHEEALFRGWIMPVMRDSWGSDFWSNAGQSVLFALAHLGTTSVPLPQLLLGYHLGYVTQRNAWTLGEGVFIHTWWDVLAFASTYSYKLKNPGAVNLTPVLWLPPFETVF